MLCVIFFSSHKHLVNTAIIEVNELLIIGISGDPVVRGYKMRGKWCPLYYSGFPPLRNSILPYYLR